MTAVIDHRRAERVRTSTDAEVIVGRHRMPAVIRSASEGGLGVEVLGNQRGLLFGATVRVAFELYGNRVELPGRIVWRGGLDDGALGVQLQLAITSRSWRRSYDCWLRQLAPLRPLAMAG